MVTIAVWSGVRRLTVSDCPRRGFIQGDVWEGLNETKCAPLLVTLSPCHLVTLSPCHLVTLSPCHLVTLSPCHLVTLSPCHLVIQGGPRDDRQPAPAATARRAGRVARHAGRGVPGLPRAAART